MISAGALGQTSRNAIRTDVCLLGRKKKSSWIDHDDSGDFSA